MKSEIQSQSIQIANIRVWIARELRRPKWACFGECGAQRGLWLNTRFPGLQKITTTSPGFRIWGSQSDVNYETIGKFLRILVQSFWLLGNPSLFYNPVAIQLDCKGCEQNRQSRSLPDFCSIAKSGQSWVDRRHLVAILLNCARIA